MDDISKGLAPVDRVFKDARTSYSLTYYTSKYIYSSEIPEDIPSSTDRIYVVNTFVDKFDFTKETVSTILADEQTRNEYNILMAEMNGEIQQILESLRLTTGLTKPKIKWQLINDFKLSNIADWPDVFDAIKSELDRYEHLSLFDDILYTELINDKALAVYAKPEFKSSIEAYIDSLNIFLEESNLLSKNFTDKSAEALGKAFVGNNLFAAEHSILLRDGRTRISSIAEWNKLVAKEFE